MRRFARWAAALFLFCTLTVLAAWPGFVDLRRSSEWEVVEAGGRDASLKGVQVRLLAAEGATTEQLPDRAAILVRLETVGDQEANDRWVDCRVSLLGEGGEVWLPLTAGNSDAVVRALSPDGENNRPCRSAYRDNDEAGKPLLSDQLFLVASDRMHGLRLHVSGLGTRPMALSFPLEPRVRHYAE